MRITEDPALPTSTPTPCILQKNSIGIEVKQLQQRLKDLGYYSGDVDGQYGTGTQTAVTAFQAQHGLKDTDMDLLFNLFGSLAAALVIYVMG